MTIPHCHTLTLSSSLTANPQGSALTVPFLLTILVVIYAKKSSHPIATIKNLAVTLAPYNAGLTCSLGVKGISVHLKAIRNGLCCALPSRLLYLLHMISDTVNVLEGERAANCLRRSILGKDDWL